MEIITPQAMERLFILIPVYGLNLLTAILVLIAGWLAAGWARRSTRAALDKVSHIDDTLKPIAANTVRYAILILVTVVVLGQFGVETTSVIAIIGAAGLAIGLALQGTLSHVASGVVLLFLRPFGIGDYIDAEGIAGTVREIGLFATELQTFDGVFVLVPNGLIIGRPIRNYSRLPTRRVDVSVGVSYGDNIEEVISEALAVLKEDTRTLPDPAPQVMVTELADSSVNVNLRCWTNRERYWDVFFDLHKAIKLRLDAKGFTIPFPQRDVHLIHPAQSTPAGQPPE